ncbi:SdpI family protein [Rhodococcus sp. IEGM 1379]|uniref:SdpI family protein n=1 Tax=Rhodococcus sp. IEGM 1379 TaxID=3047086 RepID=UPI0024B69DEB|nr:SdpI family protein [Rhodococcus sp. IEGM 1379]MDI9918342.1 SdpI family protein [Rhodococcus sp. IEGM 1379]
MDSQELSGLTLSMSGGTALLVVAVVLVQRIVSDTPSAVVGIRTRATMSSPAAWQLAHRTAEPALRRTQWIALAGLVFQLFIGLWLGFGAMASTVFSIIVFVVVTGMLVHAALLGDRAAKRFQTGR